MNRILFLFVFSVVLIASCTDQVERSSTPEPLFPQPQERELNIENGYITSATSGDTVKPIVNSYGDTVLTGISKPFSGKTLNSGELIMPEVVKVKDFETTNPYPNIVKVPDNLTITEVVDSLLVVVPYSPSTAPQNNYMQNSTGDSLKTGVPFTTKGRKVPAIYPKPYLVSSLKLSENSFYNIGILDVDQGLPSSAVNSIYVDKKDNIWLGTWYGGVCKYDGEIMTRYTVQEGLIDDYILSICEDDQGNMWFGSWNGVTMYDGDSFTIFTETEGLFNTQIWSVMSDSKGNVWFGSNRGGVCKFDGESMTHITTNEGLPDNYVRSIIEDKNGHIWMGTDQGVCKYDGQSLTTLSTTTGLSSNSTKWLIEDSKGNIWIGTDFGVNKFDGATITQFTTEQGLTNNIVRSIAEDDLGNIWFATKEGGVSCYNGSTFENIKKEDGLSDDLFWSIATDNHGNILAGSVNNGLNIIHRKSFKEYRDKNGVSGSLVLSIFEDEDGKIWLGTDKGVSIFDGATIQNFAENRGAFGSQIWSMSKANNGDMHFGTQGAGLVIYSNGNYSRYMEENGMSNHTIWCMMRDSQGNTWMGTWNGITKYDGESFTHFTIQEGLPASTVYALLEDSKGNIWIGTDGGGLCKFDGENLTIYSDKEGLSNNSVLSLCEDHKGDIWIGTWKGLNKFDGDSFTYFTEKEGMSANTVLSLTEDKDGGIWVGTNDGLNRISFKEDHYHIQTFDKGDGLSGSNFMPSSILIDSKNNLWAGTGKSLATLDLNTFNTNSNPPDVILQGMEINNQYIDYRQQKDSLNGIAFESIPRYLNYPENLELDYHQNHLTFYFSAKEWEAPEKIQYSYFLEGSSKSWSTPSPETKADFRNLPYGTHKFSVCAIGSKGKWSDPLVYEFTVLPPWWHTWWARTLYVLCGLVIVVLVFKWRTAKLVKRQKQLETEIDMATSEIRKQKEEVEHQKDIVEEAHQEIKDSIAYAKRIQTAILPPPKLVKEYLNDSFVFYKPKDVVAGDFYWMEPQPNKILFAAADCTGHGVPGAMVSVICNNGLNRSAREFALSDPGEILSKTRDLVIAEFEKSEEEVKDGMDIALCSLETDSSRASVSLKYAGAHNPLWIIRKGATEVEEIKADKQPIGKYAEPKPFTTHEVELNPGDSFYIFSDGFADQFGGEKGKKFKAKNFKELLLSIQQESMDRQKELIDEAFEKWKGNLEQLDDVCVIGVRV
jgi:ligand-binding sensor domain-containing protein/serine phosphatase RsbU (regulator of sigma subunit)